MPFSLTMTEEEKLNLPETNRTLFSDLQIAVATLIGMPIAGSLLLAQNYKNLGKINSARQTLILGFVSTIIIFFIAYLLPENFPNVLLPIIYTIAMQELVKHLQGDVIADQRGSWIITIGLAIGCSALIMGLVYGAAALFALK